MESPNQRSEQSSLVDTLRRSRSERMVAGVAGGLASHWRIDPVVVRIGFVVLTFLGLAGVILYGALWLVIPEEDREGSIAGDALGVGQERQLRTAGLIIGVVLAFAAIVGDSGWGLFWGLSWIVIPALAVYWFFMIRPKQNAPEPSGPLPGTEVTTAGGPESTSVLPAAGAPTPSGPARPAAPRSYAIVGITLSLAVIAVGVISLFGLTRGGINEAGGLISATALAIIGGGLIVGSWRGDAGWLIPIGLVTSIGLVLTMVASSIFGGTWGSTWVAPEQGHEIHSHYDHGVGEFTLDLTSVRPADLAGRAIEISTGIGATRVLLPHGTDVDIHAELDLGEIRLFNEHEGGAPISRSFETPHMDPADQLAIQITHTLGQIEVDYR